MERTNGGRRARLGPLLLLAALATLLAACSSSGQPGQDGVPPRDDQLTRFDLDLPGVPTTTLPALPTSGPLAISASVAVPIAANVQITAAEAPDGSVFVAPESHDSPTPTVVWVVDGNTPAAIAEHVAGGVSALAADSANLYVVSDSSVLGYSRSTGNQMGQWSLPPINTANTSNADLVSMEADGGDVLVMIAQGDLEYVYRFDSTSTAAPRLIAQGTSAAFGPNGSVYYERSDDRLVELNASGVTTVGPLLVHAPNGAGGGIANVEAVAGGLVWVSAPAGQGLDTQLSPYDATTLAAHGDILRFGDRADRRHGRRSPRPRRARRPGRLPAGWRGHLLELRVPSVAHRRPHRPDLGRIGRATAGPLPGGAQRQLHHERPRARARLVTDGGADGR